MVVNKSVTREKWLDIVKAIAVSAVVFHHAGFPVMFLNMVFVSVFFVTSGYVFKERSVLEFAKKQFMYLWVPFVIANVIILLSHNLLCVIGLWAGSPYDMASLLKLFARSFVFIFTDSLCAPQWFVFMIFATNVGFYVLYSISKRFAGARMDIVMLIVSAGMFVGGVVFAPRLNRIMWANSAFVTNVMVGMILYYIGYISRKYSLIDKIVRPGFLRKNVSDLEDEGKKDVPQNKADKIVYIYDIAVFAILTCALFTLYKLGYIADHRAGNFTHPWILPLVTIMGLLWMVLLAKGVIERIPFVCDVVSYVGKCSLYVMLFHGLAFQIVTFVQVKICGIAYDPAWIWQNVYMGSGLWVVSAGVVGTLAPIVGRFIVEKVKGCLAK